jgi:hypothetical protein
MNSAKPPRLATWILQHFGPELNQEALAGDLNEAFQQGRSKAWYWRQVLAAIYWRKHISMILFPVAFGWFLTSWLDMRNNLSATRLLYIAILTSLFLAVRYLPEVLEGKLNVWLHRALVIIFFLLYFPWSIFLLLVLVLHRKELSSPRYRATERQRLMEKLHLAMLEETDPQVRRAYAESIAALQRHQSTDAKAA